MEFSLTDEQLLLQEQIDKALDHISPLSRVRAQQRQPGTFDTESWQALCDLGIPGAMVAQDFGGLGLSILDAALLAEKFGKHVVASPFLGAVVLAPLAVAVAGSAQQKATLLPAIAAGELRIAVGMSEAAAGRRAGAGVDVRDGRLFGRALFVIDHVGAHQFLIVDGDGGMHLVDRDANGLEIATLDTVDGTRSTAMLSFDGVNAQTLAASTHDTVQCITSVARLALAADLLGAGGKMLDDAVAYARLREQFGRPIGSFQAVKHLCADMAAQIEPGRALLWYAGYAMDHGLPDATLCCLHAKSYLAEAARFVARGATEVHGGIGITDDLGLHFWLKRIAWSYQALGAPERLRDEAAAVQGLMPRA